MNSLFDLKCVDYVEIIVPLELSEDIKKQS